MNTFDSDLAKYLLICPVIQDGLRILIRLLDFITFLRATAATAVVHLSHRNSVCLSIRSSIRPSVCPSHGWISPKRCKLGFPSLHHWLPWRLLISESVKLVHKFEGGHPEQGCWMRGVGKICNFQPVRRWQSTIGGTLWWVQVKHYRYLAAGCLAVSGDWFCFAGLSLKLAKSRTDEIYGWNLLITGVRWCTTVERSSLHYQGFSCYSRCHS